MREELCFESMTGRQANLNNLALLYTPEAKVQPVVRRHLNRLIGSSNDVRTGKKHKRPNDLLAKSNHIKTVRGAAELCEVTHHL